jgi:GMP synthase-like glutamine amidotransferase
VIQHSDSAPGGHLIEWLEERRIRPQVLRIDAERGDVNPDVFALIVSLGSAAAAFDDSVPWLEAERRLLHRAVQSDVPVLGICFGAQLLARVLGGEARRGLRSEIGWLRIRTREPQLVPEGPWLQWHLDTFSPPPGARVIADSAAGPQAYAIGRSFGVQFHPEATPELASIWANVHSSSLEREGVDIERLLRDSHRHKQNARRSAWQLFDAFMDRIGRIDAGMAVD